MLFEPGKLYAPKKGSLRKWCYVKHWCFDNIYILTFYAAEINNNSPKVLHLLGEEFKNGDQDKPYYVFYHLSKEIHLIANFKQFKKDWEICE